jgi:UDP-N-acetylmuramate--alanine ligase
MEHMVHHIHFIGIGGIGVSGVAQLALKKGVRVSGSDIRASAITDKLAGTGARIFIGHAAENILGADLVVYSSAIRPDNPEMVAARTQRIPVKKRAVYLSDLMAQMTVVTISGAHGKTTTSSLASKLLFDAGLCPTVAVGGILLEDGDNAKCGESRFFVAEADESDGTFLCYTPTYSIITNIDHEHMDFYKTYDNLLQSFAAFVSQTKKEGCVIYCQDDPVLTSIVAKGNARSISYGFGEGADLCVREVRMEAAAFSFTCLKNKKEIGEFSVSLVGRHNVANTMAVIALGLELGIQVPQIQKALRAFKGVERRFQVKFENEAIQIVDDYGHHPAEIAATIAAAKACLRKRIVIVFQPHRYSRTQSLLDRFSRAFGGCDALLVTDIYGAGEDPVDGVTSQFLISKIRAEEPSLDVDYVAKDSILTRLRSIARPGDMVLFLGAGDITKVCDAFVGMVRA